MSSPGSPESQPPTGWPSGDRWQPAVDPIGGAGGSGGGVPPVSGTPWWALAIALIVVLALGGAIVMLVMGSGTDESVSVESRTSTPAPETGTPSAPGPPAPDEPVVPAPQGVPPPAPRPPPVGGDPDADALVEGAPDGATGDRVTPVPTGQIADIGDGWRIQVVEVIDDATDLLMADSYLEEPTPGKRYTQVSVRAGYYGLDDPTSTFEIEVFAVGRSGFELEDSCRYERAGIGPFVDVFTGGVVDGTLCFLTTPDDADDLLLRARLLGEDGVYLDTSTPPDTTTEMPTLRGPQPGAAATPARTDPVPIGVPAAIGDDWIMTVTAPATDITDETVDAGSLEPPPPGERLVAFEVEVAYDGTGSASGFDVLIGAIDDSNVAGGSYCGYLDDELDLSVDVESGDVLTGTMCSVIAEGDLASTMAYATGGYDVRATFFSLIDDPTAPPRQVPSPLIYHRRYG